jgi:hypothetical protein
MLLITKGPSDIKAPFGIPFAARLVFGICVVTFTRAYYCDGFRFIALKNGFNRGLNGFRGVSVFMGVRSYYK